MRTTSSLIPVSVSHYLHQDNSDGELVLAATDDDTDHRIISVMQESFGGQPLCRQMVDATGVQLSSDVWGNDLLNAGSSNGSGGNGGVSMVEQLTEEDRKLAEALVAVQFVQQSGRHPIMHDLSHIAKVVSERVNAGSSISLLENSDKLYHSTNLDDHAELRANDLADVPGLQSFSPLKKIPDSIWFHNKSNLQYYIKSTKALDEIDNRTDSEDCDLDVKHSISGSKNQIRKTLPHKKRIPKKLKKHSPSMLQHLPKDEHIVDDNLLVDAVNETSLSENENSHLDRALFICQICGEYYGNDQLQFFHHLKHHYEPHSTSMMMGEDINDLHHDTSSLEIDKIDENMVENSQLPDSLVELSLEQAEGSKSLYNQSKIVVYDAEKSLFNAAEKSNLFSSLEKAHQLYDIDTKQSNLLSSHLLNKMQYSCDHCRKTFKKQKHYDTHMKEVHRLDELSEFSEPEDLMEGIHVIVDAAENEEFLQSDLSSQSSVALIQHSINNQEYILPHLIIENGQLHQEHLPTNKNWYQREINESNEKTMSDDPNDNTDINQSIDNQDVSESENNKFSCPMCGEALNGKKDYAKHAQQCHVELKEEVLQQMIDGDVDVCDTEDIDEDVVDDCNSNTELTKMMQKEIALSSLKCPLCGKQFKHKSSITYHMLSHEGHRPHVCDVCKKSFISQSALKVHARLHSGDKPHQCTLCDKKFRQWGDLKYHFISLHSNQKIHKCEYCGKDFARKYSLILHRRIHTGEKNYKCEFCTKTFRASSYLQNHRRIHTGEKPHECDECGKKFRMKGDLRRHQGTHIKSKLKNERAKEEKNNPITENIPIDIVESRTSSSSSDKPVTSLKNEMKKEKQDIIEIGDKDDSSADTGEVRNGNSKSVSSPSPNTDSEESKMSSNFHIDNPSSICVWPVFIA